MTTIDDLLDTVDIRELDHGVVGRSCDLVRAAAPEDLTRPTPCAGWTLADLLAHMTAQHLGFAAAARGHGADRDRWAVRDHHDPIGAYLSAADDVLEAFARAPEDRTFALPELLPDHGFPAGQATSFHFLDYLVHGWDVARSLNLPYAPDRDTLAAALVTAELVPDGKARTVPGAAFAPRRDAPDDPDTLDRVLTLLGRSPGWPAQP
ncbi:TIGR03086 family metal-binding protein [Speluncibacter jeojiensis]|uniref:TIGR03086 family metal-binding protein n=1 Tax=Speluncibacter jeojiensis TaxID=2710754 RepID=UPI00240E9F0F|nr:TIGR03086 family metal-binding protein [Rhodococcus sp. D2-41]